MEESNLRRMRNLKMFRGKSDDEIIAYLNSRPAKVPISDGEVDEAAYDKAFRSRMNTLQTDYGVDMNNSNDVEALRSLVRHILQAENADKRIREIQNRKNITDEDVRTLKNLGDFQRGIQTTISDLQDKLGITRKVRKEKAVDDIAQWIQTVQKKANELWQRETLPITCEKCSIELARVWVNFPEIAHKVNFETECWRCKERIIYAS